MARRPRRNQKRRVNRRGKRTLRKKYGLNKSMIYRPIGAQYGNLCHMRYVEYNTLVLAVGGGMQYTAWSANGVFDPRIASGGHQPMGYNAFAAKYEFMMVEKSFIKVTFMDVSLVSSIYCGIKCSQLTSLIVERWDTQLEQGTPMKLISSNSVDTTAKKATVRSSFDQTRFYGNTLKSPYDCANTSSANPLRQGYYHLWAQAQDRATTAGTIAYTVQIDYLVKGYNPVEQVQDT